MRNLFRILSVVVLGMLTVSFMGACGGGGGGGGGNNCTSYANFSGSWSITSGTNDATGCNEGTEDLTGQTFSITQAANSPSATVTIQGHSYTGAVCNSTMTGTATYPDGAGTTTESVTATLSGNTMNVSSSWTYTEVGWGDCSGSMQFTATRVGGGDITPPTTPSNLLAAAASASQIDLSWSASTDDVGVTGYKLYRGGTFLKNVAGTSTSDTGLTASTQYCYTVSAVDAANNESAQSTQACATTSAGGGGVPSRLWTYMIYLGADNNLSDAGIGDIEEMAQVGSSADMAIVVQAEFSPYYSSGVSNSNTRRLLVQQGTAVDNLNGSTDIGNVDMGSPAALTDFITWATTTYPAQHYALVIWDHGAGWKDRAAKSAGSLLRGAVSDETSGTFMSLPDLASAVSSAGVHMDIINFDACLMAMYEVAYEFKGLVDYLVFSEETEPGDGDPYDTILGDLAGNPSMSASQLSTVIVNRYDESYVSYSASYGELTTKSAIDMTQIDALDTQVLALGQALMADAASNTVALAARNSAQHYAYTENHDIYDLANYISSNAPAGAAKTAAANVLTAIDSIVVANKTNPDASSSSNHGLAIYFPTASETNASVLAEYALLACNATSRASATGTWGEYIEYEVNQAGGGTATYGTGDFSLRVQWTTPTGQACDADLDLWVIENGTFYSPWMGQTTPNGYFSADSLISGVSMEYYQANPLVETGYYDFMVQYFDNGSTCTQARAEIFFNNSSLGIADMDLSFGYYNTGDTAGCDSAADLFSYLSCLGSNYSDFLYVGYTLVTSPPLAPYVITKAERNDGVTVTKEKQHLLRFGKNARFR